MVKKKVTKVILSLCLIAAIFIGSIPVINVEAKDKCSTKKIVTIYDRNGKKYKSGATISYSKLKNAKFKLSGVKKGTAYVMAVIIGYGEKYKLANDDEPDWAYEHVIFDPKNKNATNSVKKSWYGDKKDYQLNISKKNLLGNWIYKEIKQEKSSKFITVIVCGLDKKGNQKSTYYENYFKIKM